MAHHNPVAKYVYDHSPIRVKNWMVTQFSKRRGKAKFGPRFFEELTELSRTQWYDSLALADLQNEKLRSIIHYAYEYVPYYHGLLDRLGIAPAEIRNPEDLRRLPIMEKRDLQQHGSELRSRLYLDHPGVELFQSSGTTGRPVQVWVDNGCLQIEKAFTWLHRGWAGVHVGDLTAAFVGFLLVPSSRSRPPFWVHDRHENRVMYSLQHLSRGNLPYYAESLSKLMPKMVYGYPTAIYLVAQYLNEVGVKNVRPRGVFTASETLMPHQRVEIEEAFGCSVMDWYGASEFIANIVQCEHGSYHVKQEYGVVEVLKPDGTPAQPGEQGAVVGTGLNNLAMPLVRYKVGDLAIPREGTCTCGRGGPLVEEVTGRMEDVIVTPDGRWLTRLDFIFKGLDHVEEAQLVQHTPAELLIRVVRKPGYDDAIEKTIEARLRERMGNEIRLAFEYPPRIERTASGKFRYVVSTVPLASRESRQTGDMAGLRDRVG